jgi:hypothetical protein
MIENLIVMLIVGGSAWYAGRRYLPVSWRGRKARAKAAGCGGGCDACNACATPAVETKPAERRVIMLKRAADGAR